MQTITLQVTDKNALKTIQNLEDKHFIRIIDRLEVDSLALPGPPVNVAEFKNWIQEAEAGPTISFEHVKQQWASRKKLLQKHIK